MKHATFNYIARMPTFFRIPHSGFSKPDCRLNIAPQGNKISDDVLLAPTDCAEPMDAMLQYNYAPPKMIDVQEMKSQVRCSTAKGPAHVEDKMVMCEADFPKRNRLMQCMQKTPKRMRALKMNRDRSFDPRLIKQLEYFPQPRNQY